MYEQERRTRAVLRKRYRPEKERNFARRFIGRQLVRKLRATRSSRRATMK